VAEGLVGRRHDRGYADLAAIRFDYPYIASLEVTIDQAAHWAAFSYADANGLIVTTPTGQYIFDPALFRFDPKSDFRWILAPNARIKRKDRSQTSKWDKLIFIRAAAPLDLVHIKGGLFDGNARNNPPEWSAGEIVQVGEYRRSKDPVTQIDQLYACTKGGTTANQPHGSGDAINDGAVVWSWVAKASAWFGWEQSALLAVGVPPNQGFIREIRIEDALIQDPTADSCMIIAYSGDARNDLLTFKNIRSVSRNRTRADLIWFSRTNRVFIQDCHVDRIETEPDHPPSADGQHIFITNSSAKILDLAGYGQAYANYFKCALTNILVTERTVLGAMRFYITNSDFAWIDDGVVQRSPKTCISQSTIRLLYTARRNRLASVRFRFIDDANATHSLVNCVITVKSRDRGLFFDKLDLLSAFPNAERGDYAFNRQTETVWAWDHLDDRWVDLSTTEFAPGGAGIREAAAIAIDDQFRKEIVVESCIFDSLIHTSISANRIGKLVSRNNKFHGEIGFDLRRSLTYRSELVSEQDDFSRCRVAFNLDFADEHLILDLRGQYRSTLDFSVSNPNWNKGVHYSSRLIVLEAGPPVGGGIVGDTARLRVPGERGSIYEWRCIVSHPTDATWAPWAVVPELGN